MDDEEKSRIVDLCRGESFGFLGFDFRRVRSLRGRWRAHYTPKLKKRTALLAKLKDVFRRHQSQPVDRVIKLINPVLRGWVNPVPTPPRPAEALSFAGSQHMAPDLLFHPVLHVAEALAGYGKYTGVEYARFADDPQRSPMKVPLSARYRVASTGHLKATLEGHLPFCGVAVDGRFRRSGTWLSEVNSALGCKAISCHAPNQ